MITVPTLNKDSLLPTKQVEGFGQVPIPSQQVDELVITIATYLEVQYWTKNVYPPILELLTRYKLSSTQFDNLLEPINDVLKKKDLPLYISAKKRLPGDLDPRFVTAVSLICDTLDKRSRAIKLKEVNLSTKRFNAFLKIADYKAYYLSRVNEAFVGADESAKLALVKNIESGDLQSIKYFYEFTGQHNPQGDMFLVLQKLIALFTEILVKHVDPKIVDTVLSEFEPKLLEIDLT